MLWRKVVLSISIVVNLGILSFFKYYDFFVYSLYDVLSALGFYVYLPVLHLVVPLGISFYTFQTLSYTIDVYRGHLPVEKKLINFALYVSFFPQLVAGPIERAKHLLPQIRCHRHIDWHFLSEGIYLIGWGLFKKVVIADNIASIVNSVFAAKSVGSLSVLLGSYAFALQIYCDFSGYSDIAIGTARCLGFSLRENFRQPYFSCNPREFWQRWHMSLSSWLRDYLYIPLGGNKETRFKTYRNLMFTMLLGGLWHGAQWTFVIWGVFHGCILIFYRFFEKPNSQEQIQKSNSYLWQGLNIILFFHLICISWIIFRSDSLEQAWYLIGALFYNIDTENIVGHSEIYLLICCFLIIGAFDFGQKHYQTPFFAFKLALPLRVLVYLIIIVGILLFGNEEGNEFLYFQF